MTQYNWLYTQLKNGQRLTTMRAYRRGITCIHHWLTMIERDYYKRLAEFAVEEMRKAIDEVRYPIIARPHEAKSILEAALSTIKQSEHHE